jgi:hypothetical protein
LRGKGEFAQRHGAIPIEVMISTPLGHFRTSGARASRPSVDGEGAKFVRTAASA